MEEVLTGADNIMRHVLGEPALRDRPNKLQGRPCDFTDVIRDPHRFRGEFKIVSILLVGGEERQSVMGPTRDLEFNLDITRC